MLETKVEFYNNQRDMKRGIKRMEGQGWNVASTQAVQQGYSFAKTCCLGVLFLPLALLGRKPEKYQVTYQRAKVVQPAPVASVPVAPIPPSVTLAFATEPAIGAPAIAPIAQPREPGVPLSRRIRDALSKIHIPKMPIGCLLAAGIFSIMVLFLAYGFLAIGVIAYLSGAPTPIAP